MTQEEQLQRLIEGYLIATFPHEKIIPEFRFIGQNIGESEIDFVIGKELIPLEIKFGGRTDVCFNLRLGKGQVLEFLENKHGPKKGILVIGDKDHALENQKNNGLQSSVCVIII